MGGHTAGSLLGSDARAMLSQTGLDFFRGLDADLLGRVLAALAGRGVTGGGKAVGLGLVEVLDDALVVLLDDILGDALNAEDLDLEALAVRQGVLNMRQGLLVDLVHVHRQAAGRVQPPAAAVAFEMLGLLVGDEQLQVLEVALAVVAPRPGQDFLDVGVTALLLPHGGQRRRRRRRVERGGPGGSSRMAREQARWWA